MTPDALLQAFEAHNWMPGLVMLSLLVRTWLSDKSAFPVTLPVDWQPVVVAAATAFVNAVASVQAGLPAGTVIMSTLVWAASTGFLDGVLVAMWGSPSKAPWWGKFIVMAFDEIEGHKGPGGGLKATVGPGPSITVTSVPSTSESSPTLVEPTPSLPTKTRLALPAFALLASGCAPAVSLPGPADIALHFQEQNACVEDASTRATTDSCRKTNMVTWCKAWPAAEDCLTDAGSDAAPVAAPDAKGDSQ
ncbi:MAG TPA: hypothetical protein VK841_05315 [Polyangiaceae bacterium]|jgi:hypothetical protein|nr:hypothetical protein [Polyangiaceae bacterium]